jgi:hypothetical protein
MEASDFSASDTAASNGSSQSPWQAHEAAAAAPEHPELAVIGALAGGFILAKLLKALGGDDE